jgi:hypothetical protein
MFLEAVGNETFATESKRRGKLSEDVNRRLIIACYGSEIGLWELKVGAESMAAPMSMVVAGDAQNTARFFTENYYTRGKTVEQLKLLAVHTVRMGHLRNTAGVGADIDMVVCVPGELRRIGNDEVNSFEERSKALDKEIGDTLFTVPT